jgi:hypothetical protein
MLDLFVAMAESDCEQLRSGWLAQPANAISSAAFALVGAWVLWRSRDAGARRAFLVVGGLAMVGTGVGSVAYHGPQPGWAHVVHDGSTLVLVALIAGATTWHLIGASTRPLALQAWKAAAPWAVLAAAAYVAGRIGSPFCRPTSIWQPHAAWHALSALGLGTAARLVSGRAGWRATACPGPRPSCSQPEPS